MPSSSVYRLFWTNPLSTSAPQRTFHIFVCLRLHCFFTAAHTNVNLVRLKYARKTLPILLVTLLSYSLSLFRTSDFINVLNHLIINNFYKISIQTLPDSCFQCPYSTVLTYINCFTSHRYAFDNIFLIAESVINIDIFHLSKKALLASAILIAWNNNKWNGWKYL